MRSSCIVTAACPPPRFWLLRLAGLFSQPGYSRPLVRPFLASLLDYLFALPDVVVKAGPVDIDFDVTASGVTWQSIGNEIGSSQFNLSNVSDTDPFAFGINDANTANNRDAYDDALGIAVNGSTVLTSGNTVGRGHHRHHGDSRSGGPRRLLGRV